MNDPKENGKKRLLTKVFSWIGCIVLITIFISLFLYLLLKYTAKDEFGNNVKQDDSRIVKTFTPESKTAFEYNPPTIVNDYIYIGTSTKINLDKSSSNVINKLPMNYFYKMDLDFKIIWKYELTKTKQVDGGATLDSKGNIYFVTIEYFPKDLDKSGSKEYNTKLELISLTNDGEFRWDKQISNGLEAWEHAMVNCGIGTDDTIYVADSKIFAFDTEGNLKWDYPQTKSYFSGLRTSPIIDNFGYIYFVTNRPKEEKSGIYLSKFNKDGEIIYSTLLDNNIMQFEGGTDHGGGVETVMYSSPSFAKDFKYVYSAVGNTINKVDAQNGKIVWSIAPEGATGSFKASPAVDNYDNVYIGTKSNNESKFYAIKADGTGLLWSRNIQRDMYSSPLLGDDNKVYFFSEGSDEGTLHAVDIITGKTMWGTGKARKIPDISFGSPALYKGFIYIGTFGVVNFYDSALYKIKTDAYNYLPKAAWPRFHGGNLNNGRID